MILSEEKMGIIRTRLGSEDFDLYFTSTRILAVRIGSIVGWSLLLGAIGQGIALYLSNKKSKQLKELTLESVETSHKRNFSLSYEDILQVELKKPGLFVGKLTIHTHDKKQKFLLMQKKQYDTDKSIIEKCLKDKLNIS